MFKAGKTYEVRMIVGGEETTMWCTVESYEHPLVKFADVTLSISDFGGSSHMKVIPGEIINVTSPNFISAVEKAEN